MSTRTYELQSLSDFTPSELKRDVALPVYRAVTLDAELQSVLQQRHLARMVVRHTVSVQASYEELCRSRDTARTFAVRAHRGRLVDQVVGLAAIRPTESTDFHRLRVSALPGIVRWLPFMSEPVVFPEASVNVTAWTRHTAPAEMHDALRDTYASLLGHAPDVDAWTTEPNRLAYDDRYRLGAALHEAGFTKDGGEDYFETVDSIGIPRWRLPISELHIREISSMSSENP